MSNQPNWQNGGKAPHERGVHTVDTPSGEQDMAIITEAGLYSLILRSRGQGLNPAPS